MERETVLEMKNIVKEFRLGELFCGPVVEE